MWLFTPRGFFSVVADHDVPDSVLVRARAREDLEALREVAPHVEIRETPGRDYRFRTTLSRTDWSVALVVLAAEINYANFKDEVARRQGSGRATVYGRVWSTLLELQRG